MFFVQLYQLLTIYIKATKTKLKDECPKISQKEKETKEIKKEKGGKDKEKLVAKAKKTCMIQIKEAHENRVMLLQHIDDPKLTQRIMSLVSIMDDIIFVLMN